MDKSINQSNQWWQKIWLFYILLNSILVLLRRCEGGYERLCLDLSRIKNQNKWHVRPVKTQISLGIQPVWSESWLCALRIAKDPRFLHVDSKTLIRLGRCPGWSESWLGVLVILLVLSCAGSFYRKDSRLQRNNPSTLWSEAQWPCEHISIKP